MASAPGERTRAVVDPARVEVEHRYVDVNGFRLHYVVTGQGPPAVLVHGEAASVVDWRWSLPGLSQRFRAHALDLPGHGDSSKPDAPYSPALLADTLAGFLDALELEDVLLVGHSVGGVLAARVARRLGDRVSRLCLVDSGGLGRYIHPSNVAQTLPGIGELGQVATRTEPGRSHHAGIRAALMFARWWRVRPEWLKEQHRLVGMPGFSEATLALNRSCVDLWGQKESIVDDLADVHVPTLVVWGAEDVIVPFWHGYVAAAAVAGAQLRVLAGCGHMPHVERPDTFVDEVARFCSMG